MRSQQTSPDPTTVEHDRKPNTFSILFTAAIRSFSTDFIMAFFGGTGTSESSFLSTNDLFRLLLLLLLVIALLDDVFLTTAGCLFVDATDDEKLSDINGGDAETEAHSPYDNRGDLPLLFSSCFAVTVGVCRCDEGLLTFLLKLRAPS
jgi:hypothetical protein